MSAKSDLELNGIKFQPGVIEEKDCQILKAIRDIPRYAPWWGEEWRSTGDERRPESSSTNPNNYMRELNYLSFHHAKKVNQFHVELSVHHPIDKSKRFAV